jgi:transposase
MQITTIGIDLAKTIFQIHGVTSDGTIAFNRSLRRSQVLPFLAKLDPCLIGMEACGTSHYWAREISALGHDVKLMPPVYVKPYVKRGKTDAADAEAICEAVTRPTMRFVPIKMPEQQALLSQHRARQLLIGQRTQLSNMIRGLIGEFGYVVRKGLNHIRDFAETLKTGDGPELPEAAQTVIGSLCEQLLLLHDRIKRLETEIFAATRKDDRVRLLETIPGIGPVTASAIAATVGSPEQFKSGREFAAWLGLTPLNRSSGGKERLGRISKMGDRYLRALLVAGMTSRVRAARTRPERAEPWLVSLLERKPVRLATVAMANKTARIVWAVLTRAEPYKHPVAA